MIEVSKFITVEQLVNEYTNWFAGDRELRFGQYIYNTYFNECEPWPELFYVEDDTTAFALVANKLVENYEFDDNVVDYTGDFPNLKQGKLK